VLVPDAGELAASCTQSVDEGAGWGVPAGQIDLNAAQFNPLAPFGGYKQSGNGREFGRVGVEEFTEIKSIQR
jgi:acyl-CoA reductase-like NAD-dependent aldehyde dehydrogenase